MNFKKIFKIFIIFAILGLSFSSFLSLDHNMGGKYSGKMSSCLFVAANSTTCQMSVGEHLLEWQETFVASISSNFIYILSLLAILLPVTFIKFGGNDPPPLLPKRHDKENSALNIFNYLLCALSKGLVHPEIYA
ncbi:MAG: hypothetical protein UT84_C0001G0035 [Candidatus Curtissbacteria bacterium GW2011_GWA1_40_16]|uniref:Uncharacterized protein n=1 Tax=Candidatus Curtissbacteria bacterium GW2011_GWA1_40_16 TaxID=1618405 RepID=A0A0G0TW81_9BACT|nr:MAG: hypothetical protein UT84_C0001G0035 [Candidatus Curtissbacteria bacterium GW2011_GWA1_40_16]